MVKRVGIWESVLGVNGKLLCARAGSLSISYRTPFQRTPKAGDDVKYYAALLGKLLPDMPYGLDVWAAEKGPQHRMGRLWQRHALVSLHRGELGEAELITAAIEARA